MEPDAELSLTKRRRRLIESIGLVIITALLVFLISVAAGLYEGDSILDAIGILTNVIISIVLGVIYFNQWKTGERQADIERAMRDAQTKPALEVVDCEFERDDVLVFLGNYGAGPAQNLNVRCRLKPAKYSYEGEYCDTELVRMPENGSETDEQPLGANAVLPNKEANKFRADRISVKEADQNRDVFESAVETIARHTEHDDQLVIELYVVGEDALDEEVKEEIREPITVEISDIEDADDYTLETIARFEKNI